jgi:hypothetical protein
MNDKTLTKSAAAKARPSALSLSSISLAKLNRRTDVPRWVKAEITSFFNGTTDLDHPSAACWQELQRVGIWSVRR